MKLKIKERKEGGLDIFLDDKNIGNNVISLHLDANYDQRILELKISPEDIDIDLEVQEKYLTYSSNMEDKK